MPWYGYALLSALAIAIVGLLQKRTLQHEHTMEYVTVFGVLKLAIFLVLFFPTIQWSVSQTQFVLLVVSGTLTATAFFSIAKAMRRLEISTVLPVLSLDPGLTALLALVLLGETIRSFQLIGLALMLIGTYVLELRHYSTGWWREVRQNPRRMFDPFVAIVKRRGGYFAIAGLTFFSLANVVDRHVLQQVPVTTYLAYTLSVSVALYLMVFSVQRKPLQILRSGHGYMLVLIFIIAGLHLASHLSMAQAFGLAAAGLVIAIKRLAVLIDVIIGGKFFHEHNLAQKVLASVIILVGAFLVVTNAGP